MTETPSAVLKKNVAPVTVALGLRPGTLIRNVAVPESNGLCGLFPAIERFASLLDRHRHSGGMVIAATHAPLPLQGAATLRLGPA